MFNWVLENEERERAENIFEMKADYFPYLLKKMYLQIQKKEKKPTIDSQYNKHKESHNLKCRFLECWKPKEFKETENWKIGT